MKHLSIILFFLFTSCHNAEERHGFEIGDEVTVSDCCVGVVRGSGRYAPDYVYVEWIDTKGDLHDEAVHWKLLKKLSPTTK